MKLAGVGIERHILQNMFKQSTYLEVILMWRVSLFFNVLQIMRIGIP